MTRTMIIVEPGSTAEGRYDAFIQLIDVAADAGADVFKPQWLSSAERLCDRRHAPEYLTSYRLLQYPSEWHAAFRAHANARGLEYACSVYLPEDVRVVAPHVDYLKISSFEATDRELLLKAYRNHERVIVSSGMSTQRDMRILEDGETYWPWRELHCVSAYPAPLDDLNLSIVSGNGRYDGEQRYAGFSDHSRDVRVGAWAVCAGAETLEIHFRLNTTPSSNKDYDVAFTPAELTDYIRHVRDAERALGTGIKRVMPSEQSMLRYAVRIDGIGEVNDD